MPTGLFKNTNKQVILLVAMLMLLCRNDLFLLLQNDQDD